MFLFNEKIQNTSQVCESTDVMADLKAVYVKIKNLHC